MERTTHDRYIAWALELSRAAAAVANFCDHVEHNELAERAWVRDAGLVLRSTACAVASHESVDLHAAYAQRIRMIEERNPLWSNGDLDGAALVAEAQTWHQLQLAQGEHDRRYHPDVAGLSKFDQLRHYGLHVTKLTGAVAEMAEGRIDGEDFRARRLPDMLLFGLKLATVTGERLPETRLVGRVDERLMLVA